MRFDIILTGAKIADGQGNPLFQADIGVKDERITAIGNLSHAEADEKIDITGLVAAPGFIDVHNHAHNEVAGGILVIPKADNMLRQGVTTIVAGNCGGSPFPMGEHLDAVEKLPIRQNYACLVGHGTVRRKVMEGKVNGVPTADELDRIEGLVSDAMDEGAIGVSAGYFPDSVTTQELIAAAKGAAKKGGVYASHIRSEGEKLLEAIEEIITVGEKAELPVQISHIKTFGPANWQKCDDAIRLMEQAHDRGIRIRADRYPYIASYGGFAGIVPPWARGKKLESLSGEERKRLCREAELEISKIGGADKIIIAPWETDEEIGGKTLQQLSDEWNLHPGETAAILAARGRISAIRFAMCEENLRKFLSHPLVFVASDGHLRKFGDGTSHPRNYGTFPRVLARYVREQKLLTLEEAVRKMTSMPATQFNLKDRGVLKVNAIADIVVFDPKTVRDTATFEQPHAYPEGIKYVLVNGGIAVRDGQTTEGCFGRVIRGMN